MQALLLSLAAALERAFALTSTALALAGSTRDDHARRTVALARHNAQHLLRIIAGLRQAHIELPMPGLDLDVGGENPLEECAHGVQQGLDMTL